MSAKTIPQLPGLPLLGNALDFQRDRLALYRRIEAQLGEVGAYSLFTKPFAVLSNPRLTRQLLVDLHEDFERSPVMLMMKPILGEGLLTTGNDSNSRQRQWMLPAFHTERLPGYAQIVAEHAQRFLVTCASGQVLDLSQAMQQLTLGIISQSLFSTDVLNLAPDFVLAVTQLLHYTDQRLKFLLPFPLTWPLPMNRQLNAAISPLNAMIEQFIRERRARPLPSDTQPDLLSLLLQVRDETTQQPLSDRQIRDQILTFLFAGHETTANTLVWAFYLLSANPAIYTRLKQELAASLQGRPPAYEDLKHLPFTLQVIKETLRLYPPAYAFGRTALKDVMLGDYKVPRGMVVLACPYLLHRQAKAFPDPEAFFPDRFLPDAEASIPKFAYLPFGAGPRACIGRTFAMMEAQLCLATIAQQVSFTLIDHQEIHAEPMITLRPNQPIRVKVQWNTPQYEHQSGLLITGLTGRTQPWPSN